MKQSRTNKPIDYFLVFVFSGEGIYPAEYGKLLTGHEQPTGEYSVTLEFLRLVRTLLKVWL